MFYTAPVDISGSQYLDYSHSKILVTEVEEKLCYILSKRPVVFGLLEDAETRGFQKLHSDGTDWSEMMRVDQY